MLTVITLSWRLTLAPLHISSSATVLWPFMHAKFRGVIQFHSSYTSELNDNFKVHDDTILVYPSWNINLCSTFN